MNGPDVWENSARELSGRDLYGSLSLVTQLAERVRAFMRKERYDALLVSTRANFSWLTGGRDHHIVNASEYGVARLVMMEDRITCVTTSMEERRIAEEELATLGIEVVAPAWTEGMEKTLSEWLRGKRVASDGFEPYARHVGEELSQLRRSLTDQQREQYRHVCLTAAQAIETVARQLRPGLTEHEIAAMLASRVMAAGCAPVVTLVATDERIFRYRHPIPTDKPLERYAMLVLCAERFGLVANVTRFVHFGSLSEELLENRAKCAFIDVRMNAETRPGRTVADVFAVAVEAYRQVGYADDWKLLHQGGPTGYASREYLATADSRDVIKVHQAFAWNPSIRGVKSEDTILVGEKDNEFLTQTGTWPCQTVEYHGQIYERPDILILE